MTSDARRIRLLVAAFTAVAVAAGAYWLFRPGEGSSSADRQTEVAAKGREVMPFDLDSTTHRFAKSTTGGVQTVTADDPADTQQVRLIREHLSKEAEGFSRGDYGDPATIHGAEMPGLRDLEQGHSHIDVRYTETDAGARITYSTSMPTLVEALHSWFDAQVSDHGQHAEHG